MIIKHLYKPVVLIFSMIILFSCGNNTDRKTDTNTALPAKPAYKPTFNSDSAYVYVEKQVAFGPRVPGSQAHEKCALWMEKTLQQFIPEVTVQKSKVRTYDEKIYDCKNIIAAFHPERTDRVLLCAHWDSRHIADHDDDKSKRKQPVIGANDGASGAGILIEVARQLAAADPGIGVDLVLFDVEDYGQPEDVKPQNEDTWCLGSQYWSKNPHKAGYTARFGILLDMVGAANATFYKENSSLGFAPDVVSLVWDAALKAGYSSFFINEQGGEVTDDHLYVNKFLKVPTIDIIQQDMSGQHPFFPYWHTTKDDMNSISKPTLEAVGNTLLVVLHQVKNS